MVFCGGLFFQNLASVGRYYGISGSNLTSYLNGTKSTPPKWIDLGLRGATQEEYDFYYEKRQRKEEEKYWKENNCLQLEK